MTMIIEGNFKTAMEAAEFFNTREGVNKIEAIFGPFKHFEACVEEAEEATYVEAEEGGEIVVIKEIMHHPFNNEVAVKVAEGVIVEGGVEITIVPGA